MATEAFAPAKINLTLHVTGRRADGYHLLDSLVVFADVGDRIRARPAPEMTLAVDGPQCAGLSAGEDNLVMRAARILAGGRGAALALHKVLPVASGIGGGSADAAATLHALSRLWDTPLPDRETILRLGADVPVCLDGRLMRMSGVGEVLEPLSHPLPDASMVLVNPGASLSTPAVFAALERRDQPEMPRPLPRFGNLTDLALFLKGMRNDLEAPATSLLPVVSRVKAALAAQPDCRFTRMSGSGATCFGLFATQKEAETAATAIRSAEPDWWVTAAPVRAASAPVVQGAGLKFFAEKF